MRQWGIVVVCGILLSTGSARADSDTDAARRLYQSATKHFDLNEYEAALNDFKEGFRRKDDPVFLYNIAQCYRLLNKNEEALKFYRTYLRRDPNASNRQEVERRIASLQELSATSERSPSVPKSPPPLPPTAVSVAPPQPPRVADHPAQSSAPSVTKTSAVNQTSRRHPVYQRWWFWTGAAVVVAAGVGLGLGLGLQGATTERVLPPVQSMP